METIHTMNSEGHIGGFSVCKTAQKHCRFARILRKPSQLKLLEVLERKTDYNF